MMSEFEASMDHSKAPTRSFGSSNKSSKSMPNITVRSFNGKG